jgi:transposase
MYEYRQVLVRMRQGDSDREIAKGRLMGRHKAAALRRVASAHGWLDAQRPLPEDEALVAVLLAKDPQPGPPSQVEPFREQIIAWRQAGISGTAIHQALVREHGFAGSYSAVRRFLQGLALGAPAATVALDFAPGEAAQVDFGAGPRILDTATGELRKTWVFVMTLCFSRHQYAEVIWDQSVATWLACHRRAFEWFNAVPARLIIDNAKCAITRACRRDPEVQRAYAEYAEGYGFRIDACPPGEPQLKGRVEAGVKYIKRAFLPLRAFRDLTDANRQLRDWILAEAGNRLHGTTRAQPLAQYQAVEKALMRPLPDVPPELAVWAKVKVHRDAHVQFEKAYYSVPFRLLGQALWLKATPATVRLYRDHALVATHPRQRRAGARSTVDDHLPPNALGHARPPVVSEAGRGRGAPVPGAHRAVVRRSRARQPARRPGSDPPAGEVRQRSTGGGLSARPGLRQPALPQRQDHPGEGARSAARSRRGLRHPRRELHRRGVLPARHPQAPLPLTLFRQEHDHESQS